MKKKYQIVYESIKKDIIEGRYPEGDLLPSERELTAKFNVCRPTVAKALEMLCFQRALERTAGFGTVVLESKLTRGTRIGLLIPRLGETEIFEPICAAIDDAGQKHHWDVIRPMSASGNNDIANITEMLCLKFIREKVDGVFFTPIEHLSQGESFNLSILDSLKKADIPVVLLDRDVVSWPGQTRYDLIGIDNIQAGYVIGRHLVDQGCKRIVFATQPDPATTVQLRIMGSREALLQTGNGHTLTLQDIPEDEAAICIDTIMQHNPDALICANDATAAILMRQLIDGGIEIPKQIRVAGFDDVKYASLLSVPLTTYHQPCEDIGRSAVEAMQFRLQHATATPQRITLQGHLIIRRSTKSETLRNI